MTGFLLAALFLQVVLGLDSSDLRPVILSGTARKHCDGKYTPPGRFDSSDNLRALRKLMYQANIAAHIVPNSDEHQNEYLHPHSERLRWLSGFSGSYGTALITNNSAVLWTDARFTDLADKQLDCNWIIIRDVSGAPQLPDWITSKMSSSSRVGVDTSLVLGTTWEDWQKKLKNSFIKLIEMPDSLVDRLWIIKRPPKSKHNIVLHKTENSGKIWQAKVMEVRQAMQSHNVDVLVLTALDEIAWLLNVRGRDLPHSPLVLSYLYITNSSMRWYVDIPKVTPQVSSSLKTDNCYSDKCVTLVPYDNFWVDLRTQLQVARNVWLSNHPIVGVSKKLLSLVPLSKLFYEVSPVVGLKMVKNAVEREAMRQAHIRDGVAMCEFFSYMEDQLSSEDVSWTEAKVAFEVDQHRAEQMGFWMTSFPTHAGYGANGATPHYVPDNETALPVQSDFPFVLDSGGQFENGTTDVTRTLHLGTPTKEQIEAYTRVLQGLIEVSRASIPAASSANILDSLARAAVWDAGQNYPHATGHGVGAFLSVHEDPFSIIYGKSSPSFKEGNFFTAEPGFYKKGYFGIRLENVLEVVEKRSGDDPSTTFLEFRTATLVPFESKLINIEMLSPQQRHWLNEYNARIQQEVGQELKNQLKMKTFHWMMRHTSYVPEHCCPRSFARPQSFASVYLLISLACLVLCTFRS